MNLNTTQKMVLTEILQELNNICKYDYDFPSYESKKQFILKQFSKFIDNLAENKII